MAYLVKRVVEHMQAAVGGAYPDASVGILGYCHDVPVRWNVFRCRRVFPDVMSQTNSPLSIPTHRRLDESMNISCTNFVGECVEPRVVRRAEECDFPGVGVVEGEAAVACADPEAALRVALYACDEIVAECVGERGVVVEHIVASREAEHTFVECFRTIGCGRGRGMRL